jgi:dipeptide/tripeptide permease
MIPFGIGLAFGSEHLLKRGIPSRIARGRYLSALLVVAGLLLALLFAALPDDWLRIGLIAIALGCTPIVYSLGPAVLEVVPAPQREAMLAINNSVASLAGIAAPVATGALIQNVTGARGFELGFALCGALMVAGGLLGFWMIDPARSLRYAT